VRCDWTRFHHLAERALPLGLAGLPDLERALTLVSGRPFGGKPLPWAEHLAQEITTRIIDIAHTVATYRTSAGPHQDLDAARQAVAIGLEVDEAAELIYRDGSGSRPLPETGQGCTPRSPASSRSTGPWTAHPNQRPNSSSTTCSTTRTQQSTVRYDCFRQGLKGC
jgi:hypothetical protein